MIHVAELKSQHSLTGLSFIKKGRKTMGVSKGESHDLPLGRRVRIHFAPATKIRKKLFALSANNF